MSTYKLVINKKGNRYLKDGKFYKQDKVPINVLSLLTPDKLELDTEDLATMIPDKKCLFCKVDCKLTRFVNLQIVYLCQEHFDSQTIGKIAQRIREITSVQEEDTENHAEEAPKEE